MYLICEFQRIVKEYVKEVKIAVKNWLRKQSLEFYKTRIHALI